MDGIYTQTSCEYAKKIVNNLHAFLLRLEKERGFTGYDKKKVAKICGE